MPARVSRLLISAAFVGLFALSNSAEHLPVRVYTTADGLFSSAVHEIVRDSRGFLWFATRDGLSRFDGQRFVNYRLPADASPNIVQILARSNGDYFVMPQGGGVYRFNAATTVSNENVGGSAILNAEKISENPFGRLYEDRSGRLWASGRDLTLLEEIDGKFVLHPVPLELPNGRRLDPSRVLQAVDGGFWLTTNDGLLHLAPDLRILEFYETPPNSQIYEYLTALFEDSNGRIWVGTPDAVLIIKPRNLNEISHFVSRPLAANKGQKAVELPQKEGETVSFTVAASLNGGMPRGFSQTADGRVFITTDSGLTVFDGREFRSFSRVNGLGRPLTLSTLDTNGDLWMAGTSGAYKLAADGFTTFGIQDGLGDNIIDAIYEGADGKIYVANGRWNVSRFEDRNFATVQPYLGANLKNPLWTSNVSFPDREGSWWFLAEKKMFRFDSIRRLGDLKTRGPSAVFESNAGFFNGAFYRLFEDSRGDVWLSIRSGLREQMGLRRWNRATGDFQTFTEREGYPPASSPSAFAEDSNGNLWLGFYWGGIARFNNEHFDIFSNDAGVPKGGVFSLHFDKAGGYG